MGKNIIHPPSLASKGGGGLIRKMNSASRFYTLIFGFLILFLATGCGKDTPRLSLLRANDIIVAFGDSLTYGTGAATTESYPAVLERLIHRTVINEGVPGERTAEGLERLPSVLEKHRPALLLLCHGGNDFLQQTGDEQAAQNLTAMIQLARSRGTEVLLIGIPKPSLLPAAPSFYQEIAEKFLLPYESEILADILSDSKLKSDQVHPNAKGYQFLAESIAQLLVKAKAI